MEKSARMSQQQFNPPIVMWRQIDNSLFYSLKENR